MPRAQFIKTYSKRSNFHQRNSFEVLNALLAANLQKRQNSTKELKQPKKTKPIKLKELPPPDENHHLISDSFVGFNDFDNTFDELLKTTELDSVLKKKQISKRNLSVGTPNVTHTDNNIKEKPQRTLDKSVVDSLVIEKVSFSEKKDKDFTTLSSILDESNFPKFQTLEDKQTIELSFVPISSKKFHGINKKPIFSSTPAVLTRSRLEHTSIINDLSPISAKGESKSLIEKSYDEINTWNFKPPKEFEGSTNIISKHKESIKKVTNIKLKSLRKNKNVNKNQLKVIGNFTKNYIDTKLNMEPRVSVSTSIDILGISYSVKLRSSIENSKSGNRTNWAEIGNNAKGSRKSVESQSTPVRYLNLRKRAVRITLSKSSKFKKNLMLHNTATSNGFVVTSVERPSIGIKTDSRLSSTNITETEQLNESNEGIKLREDESIGFNSIFTSTKNFEGSPTRDTSPKDEDQNDFKSRTPSDNVLDHDFDKSEPILFIKKLYRDDEEGISNSLDKIKSLYNYSNNRWTVNLPYELSNTKECESTRGTLEFPKKNCVRRLYSLNEGNNFKSFITKHDLLRDCSTPIIAKNRIAPSLDVNRTPQDIENTDVDVVLDKLPLLGSIQTTPLLERPEHAETTTIVENIFKSDTMDKNSQLNISDENSVPNNEMSIEFNEELLHREMETTADLFSSELEEISQHMNEPCNKLNVTELNMSYQETTSNRESIIQTINHHNEERSTDQSGYEMSAELNKSCQETSSNRESIIQTINHHNEERTTDQSGYETSAELNKSCQETSSNRESMIQTINHHNEEPTTDQSGYETSTEFNLSCPENSSNRKSIIQTITHDEELTADQTGCETPALKERNTKLNEYSEMNETQLNVTFGEGSFNKLNVTELNMSCEDTSFSTDSTNDAVVNRNDELLTDRIGYETLFNEYKNMNVSQLNMSFEEVLINDESCGVFPVEDCDILSKYRNISLSTIHSNDNSAIDEDELRKDNTSKVENVCGCNRTQYDEEHSYCCKRKECENCLNESCSSSKSNPLSDVIVISDEEDVTSDPNYIFKRSNPENTTIRSFIIEVSSSDDELGNTDCSKDVDSILLDRTDYTKDIDSISLNKTNCGTANISENSLCNKLPTLNNETNVSVNESSDDKEIQVGTITSLIKKPLVLKNGKSWRRSLLQIRRNSVAYYRPLNTIDETGCCCSCGNCIECKTNKASCQGKLSRNTIVKCALSTLRQSINSSLLELTLPIQKPYGPNSTNDTIYQERDIGETVNDLTRNISLYEPFERAKSIVLRKCEQEKPIPFAECYSHATLQKCRKIGEGVYGEVFLYKNTEGNGTVMKIIPIEGSQLVNDEPQKKFSEILSEIVIAMELSKFSGFSKVKCVKCVQGRYPERLLDLWDLYDEIQKSENDSPEVFGDDQLYIILELENGGMDMESFIFKNSEEAYTLLKQISYALAVAEQELEFEHRDLHWGNILIFRCDKNKLLRYCLNGREFSIPSNGIEVSIIDFTLSRVKIDTAIIYNDISKDPDLFSASGEYQFEIYKLMQKKNSNEWEHFEAYSNVLWMHYVVDKMITALRYSNASSKIHKAGMDKLVKLEKNILKYSSVYDLVNNEFVF